MFIADIYIERLHQLIVLYLNRTTRQLEVHTVSICRFHSPINNKSLCITLLHKAISSIPCKTQVYFLTFMTLLTL